MDASRQLALECGIPPHDGLIVAILPVLDDLMEEYACDGGTGFAKNGVLIDVVPDEGTSMKWWRVRNAARHHRLQQIEPVWSGAAGEFTLQCVPERWREDAQLHMRAFSRGPWISLRLPEKDATLMPQNEGETTNDE